MADPVTGLAVAGLGVQVVSTYMAADAKAEAAHKEAENKRLQAKEVEVAGEREQDLLRIRGQKAMGQGENAVAQAGIDMSGSSLLAMEDVARQITSESMALDHATKFRASQLRAGANLSDELGDQAHTAGILDATATGLSAAARGYKILDPNSGSTRKVGQI
jgi:hypothetical protein